MTKKITPPASSRSVLAREEDGTIQLTLTIPKGEIDSAEAETLAELAKNIEIPGFRPGFAPVEEVKKHVSSQVVLEKLLGKVLPKIWANAIKEHGLSPVLSPRFELVRANSRDDWQVRAVTCEAPTIEAGDYREELKAAFATDSLWIPGKDSKEPKKPKKEKTQEEKEQLIISTLLNTVKGKIPKPLIDEEVNHKLASLVEQTQKLGLTVDQYLTQTGKTAEQLRRDYEKQAQEQILLMLALAKIGEREGIEVTNEEILKALGTTGDGKAQELSNAQKEMLKGILLRRRALDRLINFV